MINREVKKQNSPKSTVIDKGKNTIETRGPVKNKNNKVLHSDGSLADLPDQDVAGAGALDGTVGLGS
jgi:hypothetical protein